MAAESHAVDLSHAMFTQPVAFADWLVIAPVVTTIIGGAICLMTRKQTTLQPWIGTFVMALLVAIDAALLLRVVNNGPVTMVMGNWLPPFGIAFTVDAFGALMALVGAVIALTGSVYALVDVRTLSRRYGFYPLLMLLMTGVSGAFLTGDIFNLYVWFEVTLISSFGLLILGSSRPQLDGAVKYAFLNLIATTLFLVAVGYLYGVLGTLNMADIVRSVRELPDAAPIGTIAALFLLAFAMKAAAFPINFWLPASYHTPRIVVGAVFAGLLTKVGVYSLIRILVMLMPENRAAMSDIIVWLAIGTMLSGVLGALAQNDIRRMLGYLVVSGIGSMLVGLALGTADAVGGALLYAIHSMLVMTALYYLAGIMRRTGGAFDLAGLGGLYGANPLLAGLFLVLGLAVSGLPPFSGFWPKVVLVEASLKAGEGLLAAAILLTGFLTTLAVGRVWLFAFWRGGPLGTPDGAEHLPTARVPHETRLAAYLPVFFLVALIVWLGVWPEPVFAVANQSALGMVDPSAYLDSVFGGSE
ncbi:multicomponent Na+:H+ antiporter subunit D [Rhodobium orientis]|uniref:Na+/H+ antiporter subunit D n=1 Tax=Rhodobium orientis TaxID=34017 RepID=A0A327JIF6_9HYPH|nr:Na+/H+ antiporter subunit D [Rhodobium orientis]MBB4303797.1 multicomponent Na+:H+ antiporter subunit D [Rhodobium orientis]MBK5947915.1 Na+/H+ antiporter subunit D [Rhodobium orientis]RAI26079.1 Na+/H+ antiporter subunit D [Rhodobium orientis]